MAHPRLPTFQVPDSPTPDQWTPGPTDSPSRRLALAVLESALHDLRLGQTGRGYELAMEAWRWVHGAPAPYQFRDVCHALDFEPAHIRRLVVSRFQPRQRTGVVDWGARLRAIEARAGWSPNAVAVRLGKPAATVMDYRRGKYAPSPAVQAAIEALEAEVFGG